MLIIFLGLVLICITSIFFVVWKNSNLGFFVAMSSFFGLVVLFLSGAGSYIKHAEALGTIRGQQAVIQVYQERVDQLSERLNSLNYPKGSAISLNADSPIASIVGSLSEAEIALASAKEKQAQAVVDIEQRKAGPYSILVSWMGEK